MNATSQHSTHPDRTEQNDRLLRLFDRFVVDHLETPEGRAELALYERAAREGRTAYREVLERIDSGADITEGVLLRLLPYFNTRANVKRGGWIHVTPTLQGKLQSEFERREWIEEEDWPRVAREIFRFVHNAVDDPAHLAAICREFDELSYVKGIQSGMLSPILEAVRPKQYAVVTPRTHRVLRDLFDLQISSKLIDYPEANRVILEIVGRQGAELVERSGLHRFPPVRLFNLFCWWADRRREILVKNDGKLLEEKTLEDEHTPATLSQQVEEPERTYRPDRHIESVFGPDEMAEALHLPAERIGEWLEVIRHKRQAILYGPPGTGKTFIAEHLARCIVGGTEGFREIVQFHPSYSYEDFVQGIRPQRREEGGLDYPVVEGRFLRFCREARMRGDAPCLLVIDEINRANLSEVFGELMYLLEYRDRSVPLAVDGRLFSIPSNVILLGTMNTADRSIALVDHALRRRFAFIEIAPDYDLLRRYAASFPNEWKEIDVEGLIATIGEINQRIDDRNFSLGISFFLRPDIGDLLGSVWKTEIEPYLEEYWFDDPSRVDPFRWSQVRENLRR